MNTNKYYFAKGQPTTVVGVMRALLDGKTIIWNTTNKPLEDLDPEGKDHTKFWINADDQIRAGINERIFSIQSEFPQITPEEVDAKKWAVIERRDWFDLVSEVRPVLCWVKDHHAKERERKIVAVIRFDHDDEVFLDQNNVTWGIAEPLSKEEIQTLLQNTIDFT